MELLNQELLEQDKGTQELLRQVLEGTKIFHFYYYPQKRLEVMPVRTSKYLTVVWNTGIFRKALWKIL